MATNDIGRVTPIWRGFFSSAATYELNDIVIDTAGSVWWHKSEELTTGVIPAEGETWAAVIDMSVFSALIQAAITTAQTAVQAAQEAESEVAEDVRRAETAAQSAEASAEAASESAAGVGALAQAAEQSKTEAQTAATQAAASASSAGASATSAGSSAQTAEAAKTAAQTAATQAAGSAETASGAAAVVEQKKTEALAAIQAKGEDVLESIPEDYTELSGDVGDLKTQLYDIVDNFTILTPYVDRKNAYIDNTTHEYITAEGYDTYKIPLEPNSVFVIKWDSENPPFVSSTERNRALKIENSDSWINMTSNTGGSDHYFHNTTQTVVVLTNSSMRNLYMTCRAGTENGVSVYKNKTYPVLNQSVVNIDYAEISEHYTDYPYSRIFLNTSNVLALIAEPYNVFILPVMAGSVLYTENLVNDTLNYIYTFREFGSNTVASVNTDGFHKFDTSGILCVFTDMTGDEKITLYNPTAKEKYKFLGKEGVAFGTSLTYRALTTGGYLQFLPQLMRANIENQGIGGANIVGRPSQGTRGAIMTALMDYTGYLNKDFCIIEGFVNDWHNAKPLGLYNDATESSVCGCLNVAISYLRSVNPGITVFVILDHCGRNDGSVDFTRAVTNTNNLTQYEFYAEIEKCAKYLGIHCINLLTDSEIGENTPQYFIDYIHPNEKGAEQIANTIWSSICTIYPNAQ